VNVNNIYIGLLRCQEANGGATRVQLSPSFGALAAPQQLTQVANRVIIALQKQTVSLFADYQQDPSLQQLACSQKNLELPQEQSRL
jgi:hypothetical protein